MPVSAAITTKVATFLGDQPDWAVANTLNAPDSSLPGKKVKVAVADVRGLILANGFWPGIVLGADDATIPVAVRGLCLTTRDTLLHLDRIDSDRADVFAKTSAMITGLLAAGLIDQATHDAIIALADAPQSWADLNNNGVPVTARDVGIARGAVE